MPVTRLRLRSSMAVLAPLILLSLTACERGQFSGRPDFADLVDEVSPSVVNISAVTATLPAQQQASATEEPNAEGAPKGDASEQLPDWFKKYYNEHGGEEAAPSEDDSESQSLGSGFVLWDDGYILTNFHVVRDAKEVVVRLLDRRQFTAQVIGGDEPSDLALLKIDATDLPVVKLADSGKVRPGQWVLAIGSPFGFDYSVTAGIVSAKGRALQTEQYVPFIQSDVAINPGNSGGPLFNLKGEVVGVNSQIYSQSGGYQGVSFSIPIDVAAKVARQLKEHGKVTRGWLGVVVQEVDRATAQKLGMDKPEGALVARVISGSPGEKAGLKSGDVILTYNDHVLASSTSLPPEVGSSDPGEIVTLQVMRERKKITIKVEVGKLDAQLDAQAQDVAPQPKPPVGPLGMVAVPLTAEQRRSAQVVAGGVLISDVSDGPALRAGIRPGDVLLQINGQQVDSVQRLTEVVTRLTPGASVPLLVQRRGAPLFLALDLPSTGKP
ncbi:serine peptidase [Stenotrophobium rhamnosiphilum]|uniref:Probable periplasmic serine endoprotease DegP-like n=2 Tax=Stenotrophobium rhamnosiphilum TaxID=2029166 RepID=A0A2T5ML76_9GAMM|nr:serine peptidase [Stenotrophobium rhamnosiphilum]